MIPLAFMALVGLIVLVALYKKNSVKLDVGAWGTHVRLEAEGKSEKRK